MVFFMLGIGAVFGGAAAIVHFNKNVLTNAQCPNCTDENGTTYPEVYLDDVSEKATKAKVGEPCICTGCDGRYMYHGNGGMLTEIKKEEEEMVQEFSQIEFENSYNSSDWEDEYKVPDIEPVSEIRPVSLKKQLL